MHESKAENRKILSFRRPCRRIWEANPGSSSAETVAVKRYHARPYIAEDRSVSRKSCFQVDGDYRQTSRDSVPIVGVQRAFWTVFPVRCSRKMACLSPNWEVVAAASSVSTYCSAVRNSRRCRCKINLCSRAEGIDATDDQLVVVVTDDEVRRLTAG